METVAILEETVEVNESVRDVEVVAQSSTVELAPEAERCANLGAVAIVCASCPMLQYCQKPITGGEKGVVAPPEGNQMSNEPVIDNGVSAGADARESTAPTIISTATSSEMPRESPLEQEIKPEPSYLERLLDDSVDVVLARSLETQSDSQPYLAEPLDVPEPESGGANIAIVETKPIEIAQTVLEPEASLRSDEQVRNSDEVSEKVIIPSSEIVHEVEHSHQTPIVVTKAMSTIVARPSQDGIYIETIIPTAPQAVDIIVEPLPVSGVIEIAQPESTNEFIMTDIPLVDPVEMMEPIFMASRIEVVTEFPYVFELPSDSKIATRTKNEAASFEDLVVTSHELPPIDSVEKTPTQNAVEYSDPDVLLHQLVPLDSVEVLVAEESADDPVVVFLSTESRPEVIENLDKATSWTQQTELYPVGVLEVYDNITTTPEPAEIAPETDIVYGAIIRSEDTIDPELKVFDASVQGVSRHTIGVLRQLLAVQALSILFAKWRTFEFVR